MSKIIALIPARGGSKGIKHKNIVDLAGKPLIAHTILAAQSCNKINDTYVSSESTEILSVAKLHNCKIIERNIALAQDDTPTSPVIQEFIQHCGLEHDDIVVLLQPTSPLRTADHISKAISLYTSNPKCAALVSVVAAENKYLYAYKMNEGILNPVMSEYHSVARRQDLPKIYLPNGAIYIFNVKNFNEHNKIPSNNVMGYEMSQSVSIDIDNLDDLERAEASLLKVGE
jgi:CMP-N,N'-diacetyllegionaminic acid synthase